MFTLFDETDSFKFCYFSRHKADSLTPNQIAGREESPKASQRVELGSCSPPQTAQPYLKVRGAFILKSLFIPPCKMMSSPLFTCILLDPGTVVDCICIYLIELYYELDSGIQEDFIWTDHLSPQLQRNQQILLHNGPRVGCRPRNKRRRVLGDEGEHASTASQLLSGSSLKKACRNLSLEFCTAEELAHTPPVDSWVLQTLGLKDVDTIDHSANYSDLLPSLDDHNALHADSGVGVEYTGSPCSLDTRYLSPLSSSSPQAQSTPLPSSATPSLFKSPYSVDVSRNKTEVAFTMSLKPHRNVKTHSFNQGQAFVCRDEQAGWKFTWVPKQSE
ncbi:Geminin coiled-coil domain-containing protein 1 [Acipenser ruthenus]|uniref:Geminin coiled-coil domain-containing protein 1 n=1 Tax=Acipenser ruthenus TaxID=7906 RepID=A0A444UIU5_ACIRT|nr:Geminin coiled-coil domain-containing protein 1 [Acipenser ruthenus]